MRFFQEHLLSILIFGGFLLLLGGLLLFAIFRKFKPSPRQPPSLFLVMAACSVPRFIAGCSLATVYLTCSEKRWFSALYSMLPAGWEDIHLLAATVGSIWSGSLTVALVGGWLWQRRLHARP